MPAAPRTKRSTRTSTGSNDRHANRGRTSGTTANRMKINEKYKDNDADVELYSSDEVKFRVHSYRLQGASPQFRALLARNIPDRNIIRFSNEDADAVETAQDLEFILDIIYTLVIPPTTYEPLQNAIQFAQEYEVETVITLIRQAIIQRVQLPIDPHQFDHFRLAIQLDDGPLAASAFKPRATANAWEDVSDDGEAGVDEFGEPWVIEGQNVFEFGAAEFSVFCEIPPMAVWIVLRARCLADGPGRGICKNEKEFATQLRRLMSLYYNPDEPKSRARWFYEALE